MKANETKVEKFLVKPDIQFIIPIYQRNYDWTIPQCKQLLNDIYQTGADDQANAHFIGSIVYIHDDIYTTSDTEELIIIDGQQRLTTLTLIYIALYRELKQIDQTKANRINEKYLINKDDNEESKLKLKATEKNDKELNYLLSHEQNIDDTESSNISNNFNYIVKFIKNKNYKIILNGLRKLIFVEIALERGKDNPQNIFESLNSTGLELSQGDLIRNYILMNLKPAEQKNLYKSFWQKIEIKAKDEATKSSKVSDFIRDYLTLKIKKIPNKKDVYLEFKKYYSGLSFEDREKELQTIVDLVNYYHKLINPEKEADTDIKSHLKYINQLEVSVVFPFLMQVYSDYNTNIINKETFIQVLELIQSFVWRRFIVGEPTNALNKIFMGLHSKVNNKNYLYSIQQSLCSLKGNQKFPKDEEVINALKIKDVYNIKKKNTAYLLERLENFNNNELVDTGDSKITIEHIFPQNPSHQWKYELGSDECKDIEENYLHTISNLTLSGNNGALGNKSFQEKRDLKNKGYKDSRLWLNRHLAQLDKWDKDAIEERFKKISAKFLEIWKHPNINVSAIQESNEVNIFKADDPTGKILDYAIFSDEEITVKDWTAFYVAIIKRLYQRDPKPLFSSELKNLKLTVNNNKDDLRQSAKINDLYCIETNSSNLAKFENIKQALKIYRLEKELFIKYQA